MFVKKDFDKMSELDLLFYVSEVIDTAFEQQGITSIDTGTGFGQRDMLITLPDNRQIVVTIEVKE